MSTSAFVLKIDLQRVIALNMQCNMNAPMLIGGCENKS